MKNKTFSIALIIFAVLVIAGSGAYFFSNNKAETEQPTIIAIQSEWPGQDVAMQWIADGKEVKVILDACPFDDEGYLPENDPLGTLLCNETYTVTFNQENDTWTATGLSESYFDVNSNRAESTISVDSVRAIIAEEYAINIWGGVFLFDADGNISSNAQTVGKIRFSNNN